MAKVKQLTLPEYIASERGRAAALASALGVHKTQISNWASGRSRPGARYCVEIERATGGAVSRQKLRDDWRVIWPELLEPCRCPK